jgi:ribonuclease D
VGFVTVDEGRNDALMPEFLAAPPIPSTPAADEPGDGTAHEPTADGAGAAAGELPSSSSSNGAEPEPGLQRLDFPRDGVPPVIVDRAGLERTIAEFAAGEGPVAVDAERASGHRYGQRAFLVQLRREGAGTALIDPVLLPDLSELNAAIAGSEWVLHAASQDLPCLLELGLHPEELFDTELGGRLAGFHRVGLAAMVEELLGLSLAKEHSAVDWSTRPLPEPWLRYAALDVEVLTRLRDEVAAELERQGKLDWAREEFAAVAAAPSPAPRIDPWRRTSGMHRVRDRRRLAAVRELWNARDAIARERDLSPGRVLPDSAIVEAALAMPTSPGALTALPGLTGRGARRNARNWFDAVERARTLPDADLPPQHLPTDGPPPPRVWRERDPAAAVRLGAVRAAVTEIAESLDLPVENLVAPDSVRRLAWTPPAQITPDTVAAALRGLGAREWQIGLAAPPLTAALLTSPDAASGDDPFDGSDDDSGSTDS